MNNPINTAMSHTKLTAYNMYNNTIIDDLDLGYDDFKRTIGDLLGDDYYTIPTVAISQGSQVYISVGTESMATYGLYD